MWRWLPLVVPLGWLAVLTRLPIAETVAREEVVEHRAASVTFSVIWVLAAALIALSGRHRTLGRNLRRASVGGIVVTALILIALGVLSWQVWASWSWLPVLLLLMHLGLTGAEPRFAIAAALVGVLLPAAIVEAALYELRTTPSLAANAALQGIARQLYYLDRSVAQYHRPCAQYDPELFYTLRPGTCVFENTEFRNEFRVNSLGVRDDEASLDAPDIVVIGDSTTMGWGVMEQQAYPALLEEITHLRVLNTGISSYATNREMKMLSRVDRSHMRWLLLQYCPNDAEENEYYRVEHEHPHVLTEREFENIVRRSEIERRYYPGRYLTFLLDDHFLGIGREFGLDWPPAPVASPAPGFRQEVSTMLGVLEDDPLDLDGVEILMYEIPEKEYRRDGFPEMVGEVLKDRVGRRNLDHIRPVDVVKNLRLSDFRILDGHINPDGHKKVADALARAILHESSVLR